MHYSYITNESGKTEAVIIPVKDWDKIVNDLARTKKKLEILNGIEQGMKEIELFRKGKKKLKTIEQILDEV